jgi:hypothetical protein
LFFKHLILLVRDFVELRPDLIAAESFFPVFWKFLGDIPPHCVNPGVFMTSIIGIMQTLGSEAEVTRWLCVGFEGWDEQLKKSFCGNGLKHFFTSQAFPFQSLLVSTQTYYNDPILFGEFWSAVLGARHAPDIVDVLIKFSAGTDTHLRRRLCTRVLCGLLKYSPQGFEKYEYYSPFLILAS